MRRPVEPIKKRSETAALTRRDAPKALKRHISLVLNSISMELDV
jgi:hypothetical protein